CASSGPTICRRPRRHKIPTPVPRARICGVCLPPFSPSPNAICWPSRTLRSPVRCARPVSRPRRWSTPAQPTAFSKRWRSHVWRIARSRRAPNGCNTRCGSSRRSGTWPARDENGPSRERGRLPADAVCRGEDRRRSSPTTKGAYMSGTVLTVRSHLWAAAAAAGMLGSAGLCSAQSAPADQNTSSSSQEVALQPILVSAPRYVPTTDTSATKIEIPLIETPQSTTVVNRDQLDVLNVQNLQQAVRYTSGVVGENYGPDE